MQSLEARYPSRSFMRSHISLIFLFSEEEHTLKFYSSPWCLERTLNLSHKYLCLTFSFVRWTYRANYMWTKVFLRFTWVTVQLSSFSRRNISERYFRSLHTLSFSLYLYNMLSFLSLEEHGQQRKEMATWTAARKMETSLLETPASLPRPEVFVGLVYSDVRPPKCLRYPELLTGWGHASRY